MQFEIKLVIVLLHIFAQNPFVIELIFYETFVLEIEQHFDIPATIEHGLLLVLRIIINFEFYLSDLQFELFHFLYECLDLIDTVHIEWISDPFFSIYPIFIGIMVYIYFMIQHFQNDY